MSTLTQFSGGGVRQIKTGFIYNAAPTNSAAPGSTSAEDYFYYDVTLTGDAVSDVTKCIIVFDGLGHYSGYNVIVNGFSGSSVYNTRMVTTRLQNTTTLRLCQQYDATVSASSFWYHITGRWTLIEYR